MLPLLMRVRVQVRVQVRVRVRVRVRGLGSGSGSGKDMKENGTKMGEIGLGETVRTNKQNPPKKTPKKEGKEGEPNRSGGAPLRGA